MKVFISHSGDRSRELAEKVAWFVRILFPATEPWVSTDIDKGSNWDREIAESLRDADVGIVCLTRENLDARWILFEAGALAKQLDNKVCTLLLDVQHEEVLPPLNKFQHTRADREQVWQLVETVNKVATEKGKGRRDVDLRETFDSFWPKLEAAIISLQRQTPATEPHERPTHEMLVELLGHAREAARLADTAAAEREAMLEWVHELHQAAFPRARSVRLADTSGANLELRVQGHGSSGAHGTLSDVEPADNEDRRPK